MTHDEMETVMTLRDPVEDEDEWQTLDDADGMQGILNGEQPVNISHHGGEFEAMAKLYERVRKRSGQFGTLCYIHGC